MSKFINPLDELFQTPPNEMDVDEYREVTSEELQQMQVVAGEAEVDPDDAETDSKIDKVYTLAIDAFNTQTEYQEIIEPRYAARNAEVAANYLSIALNAATSKARVKIDRKKAQGFIPFTNQGSGSSNIVASREDILRMISVDAEIKKV